MKQGIENQPLTSITWIEREKLKPNLYNPNQVMKTELQLLKTSILEDGWTQPIVVNQDLEIVDGFHRWTISDTPELREMTGGLVPIVTIEPDKENQMMSTIRHNRARGHHQLLRMQDIVRQLLLEGYTSTQLGELLGMEEEEVIRLTMEDDLPEEISKKVTGFSKGWKPTN